MKLDTRVFRYLSQEDWRVLTAVELGSKNHEVVPTSLISQLSSLRTGLNGCQKSISTLAKANLIARVQHAKYDGYRLTYGGYDYLALRTLTNNGSIIHLGSQMGVGKESDIYLVTSPSKPTQTPHTTTSPSTTLNNTDSPAAPCQSILKIHRLGRTSFRSIRNNRAYHGSRAHCSWQYLSRLSATKEYAAMRALHDAGFPVPEPIAQNRHTIVMSLVPGLPMRQVPRSLLSRSGRADDEVARIYGELMELLLRLAGVGLIHGDFNEFNILLCNLPEPDDEQGELATAGLAPTQAETEVEAEASALGTSRASPLPASLIMPHLIDFPQITSLTHPQAAWYFSRDVTCIKDFFRKRYHFTATRTSKRVYTERHEQDDGAESYEMDNQQGEYDEHKEEEAEEADSGPTFADAQQRLADVLKSGTQARLDVAIEAAGFNRKMARDLERYYEAQLEGDNEPDRMNDEDTLSDSQIEDDFTSKKLSLEISDTNGGVTARDEELHVEVRFAGSDCNNADVGAQQNPDGSSKYSPSDAADVIRADGIMEQDNWIKQESIEDDTTNKNNKYVAQNSELFPQRRSLVDLSKTSSGDAQTSTPKVNAKARAGWSI